MPGEVRYFDVFRLSALFHLARGTRLSRQEQLWLIKNIVLSSQFVFASRPHHPQKVQGLFKIFKSLKSSLVHLSPSQLVGTSPDSFRLRIPTSCRSRGSTSASLIISNATSGLLLVWALISPTSVLSREELSGINRDDVFLRFQVYPHLILGLQVRVSLTC